MPRLLKIHRIMSKNTKEQQPDSFENVQETLNKAELFIDDHKSVISYAVIGILAIVAIFFAFKRFYLEPKNDVASAAMFGAEQYFQRDSFEVALNGDGNYAGFLDVIDDYGMTQTAKLANYYAGLCYMYMGDFESAISHLKKFKSKDVTLSSVALGVTGDAYVELGEEAKGASYYEKAAANAKNDFTSPLYLNKAAQVYEKLGNYKKALALYTAIKNDYALSQEAMQIEKNIERMNAEIAK